MWIEEHGGECCGIRHLHEFEPRNEDSLKRLDKCIQSVKNEFQENLDYDEMRGPPQGAIEVVLTDGQMQLWWSALKTRGFRQVVRFKNSNSGNYCNVLYLTFGQPRGKNRKPKAF